MMLDTGKLHFEFCYIVKVLSIVINLKELCIILI